MASAKKSTAKKKILYYYKCPVCQEEGLSFDIITADGQSKGQLNRFTKEQREKQKKKMKEEARKVAKDAVLEKEQDYLERINHQRNLFGVTMHAQCAKCNKSPIWTWFSPTSLSRGGILTSIMLFVFAILKSGSYDRKICSLIFAIGAVPAVVCLLIDGIKTFLAQKKLDELGEAFYPIMLTADTAEHFIHARKMGQQYTIPGFSTQKNPLVNSKNAFLVMCAHLFLILGFMLPFSGIAYGIDTTPVLFEGINPGILLLLAGCICLVAGTGLQIRHLLNQKKGGF